MKPLIYTAYSILALSIFSAYAGNTGVFIANPSADVTCSTYNTDNNSNVTATNCTSTLAQRDPAAWQKIQYVFLEIGSIDAQGTDSVSLSTSSGSCKANPDIEDAYPEAYTDKVALFDDMGAHRIDKTLSTTNPSFSNCVPLGGLVEAYQGKKIVIWIDSASVTLDANGDTASYLNAPATGKLPASPLTETQFGEIGTTIGQSIGQAMTQYPSIVGVGLEYNAIFTKNTSPGYSPGFDQSLITALKANAPQSIPPLLFVYEGPWLTPGGSAPNKPFVQSLTGSGVTSIAVSSLYDSLTSVTNTYPLEPDTQPFTTPDAQAGYQALMTSIVKGAASSLPSWPVLYLLPATGQDTVWSKYFVMDGNNDSRPYSQFNLTTGCDTSDAPAWKNTAASPIPSFQTVSFPTTCASNNNPYVVNGQPTDPMAQYVSEAMTAVSNFPTSTPGLTLWGSALYNERPADFNAGNITNWPNQISQKVLDTYTGN